MSFGCQVTAQVRYLTELPHHVPVLQWFKSSGKSSCPHCQSPW